MYFLNTVITIIKTEFFKGQSLCFFKCSLTFEHKTIAMINEYLCMVFNAVIEIS
jgi:hypothetical protein